MVSRNHIILEKVLDTWANHKLHVFALFVSADPEWGSICLKIT